MPIYSDQELAQRALRKLLVSPHDGGASAEDIKLVADKIEGMLSELKHRGVYFADSIEQIRPEAFDAMADVLAEMCLGEFGINGPEAGQIRDRKTQAEYRLRVMNRNKPPMAPVQAPMF